MVRAAERHWPPMNSPVGTDSMASVSCMCASLAVPAILEVLSTIQQPALEVRMTSLSPRLLQATPVTVDHARGSHVYGTDGRAYLDFTAGIGVVSTGHCHPRVVAAAQEQVGSLIHGQYTTVMHRPLLQLTERLGSVLPAELDSLFFANSGSEAVEAALRLARQATGRPNVVVFHGGFHGRTVAAASMTTSGTRFSAGFSPLMSGVHVAPFPTAYRYGWDEAEATRFEIGRASCRERVTRGGGGVTCKNKEGKATRGGSDETGR